MALLPSETELANINDVEDARVWIGLAEDVWHAVNSSLGGTNNLRVVATLPAAVIQAAIQTTRVTPSPMAPVTGGMAKATAPPPPRTLTPVESSQVGLLYRAARAKFKLDDVDPLEDKTPATPVKTGSAGGPDITPTKEGMRKIKFNQVVDQGDEGEIPQLDFTIIEEMHKTLVEVKGGTVPAECEPSSDQMSALRTRVVEFKLSPYADFALFTPYHLRHLKHLKFKNHILQPDGSFRTVEVPGPPNFDAWYASWRVFENTLLMIKTKDASGALAPIVSQAALDEYRENFRNLVTEYPESWHLCVTAEDRNRAENFDRIRRNAEKRFLQGLEPEFKVDRPWDYVFRVAARDRDYWSKHVREPAMIFLATGGKRKLDPTGAATGRTDGDSKGTEVPPKKPRNQKDTPTLPPPWNPKGAKGGGWEKGSGKNKGTGKKDAKGRFELDRNGKEICYGYNNGNCKGVCPQGRSHVCQRCLGNHPAIDCKSKGKNN